VLNSNEEGMLRVAIVWYVTIHVSNADVSRFSLIHAEPH